MSEREKKLVRIHGRIVKATVGDNGAMLIQPNTPHAKEVWIPKSQIEDTHTRGGVVYAIDVSEWIAKQKGLI
ncbi:hypothetical protein DLP3_053 [Stenotrophomonas phage vB_SmaS_DLP_3]|nr:hypothetical protein DLP3_053 [Stenotrophomonas phage vB_SmaS_DLP_3]